MSVKLFYCNAGRDLIKISVDLWQDFKDFFNQYEKLQEYRIEYKNLDIEALDLSRQNTLNDFLHVQLEVLGFIICERKEKLDHHELLISLKSSLKEFKFINHLLNGSQNKVAQEYLRFINEQIIPIYNLEIESYEEILKIKHHKSYVRNKIEEFGEVKILFNDISSEILKQIKCYFDKMIPDAYQRAHFYQEIFEGRTNEIVYDIFIKDAKNVCKFFNFLHGSEYLTTDKTALGRWMSRKFKRINNGQPIGSDQTLIKYLQTNHDPKFLNKI